MDVQGPLRWVERNRKKSQSADMEKKTKAGKRTGRNRGRRRNGENRTHDGLRTDPGPVHERFVVGTRVKEEIKELGDRQANESRVAIQLSEGVRLMLYLINQSVREGTCDVVRMVRDAKEASSSSFQYTQKVDPVMSKNYLGRLRAAVQRDYQKETGESTHVSPATICRAGLLMFVYGPSRYVRSSMINV